MISPKKRELKNFDSLGLTKKIGGFVIPKDKLIRSEVRNKLDDEIFRKIFNIDIEKFANGDYPTKNKKSTKLDRQTRSGEAHRMTKANDIMLGRRRNAFTKSRRSKTTSARFRRLKGPKQTSENLVKNKFCAGNRRLKCL